MFQRIPAFIIAFVTVIIQLAVFSHFFSPGTAPNLALVLVVIWTVNEGFERMFWRTVLLGFLADIFFFWPIGFNIISYVIISFITSSLAKRFLISPKGWKIFFILSALVLGTFINQLILNGLFWGYNILSNHELDRMILKINDVKVIFSALNTAVSLFLIYWPLKKTEEFLSIYNHNLSSQARFYRK